ncbi:MAG: hypothetical protein AAGF95_28825 [Chloroflexota bacterium]
MPLDFSEYEGAFCDLTEPGYHVIEKNGIDLVKIPKLEVQDRVLHCEYEVLQENLSTEEVADLVFIVLLKRFCNNYYKDKADFVRLLNRQTNESYKLANIF